MDLKKYLDCLGENEDMDVGLIRVRVHWADHCRHCFVLYLEL